MYSHITCPRGGNTYKYFKNIFMIGMFWNMFKNEKYYKGTESILYWPYIPDKSYLKIYTRINKRYYGLTCNNIYFDEFIFDLTKCPSTNS